MAAKQYLVRIPPQSPRVQHTILGRRFRKSDGWVGPLKEGVDDDLIEALRAEPLNELHPDNSPKVFEVKLRKDAAAVHNKESKKKKPAGTPDKPNEPPPVKTAKGARVGAGKARASGRGRGKPTAKDDGGEVTAGHK
jgi:hypothetical protein